MLGCQIGLKILRKNNMHPAMMDYDWVPLSTQPYLLECDVDLVKEAFIAFFIQLLKTQIHPQSLYK